MDLLLQMLRAGVARFESATAEFCFDGLRYSCRDGDWNRLMAVIGWDKARAAIVQATGRTVKGGTPC